MAITTAAQTTAKKETSRSGLQLARIWDQYGMLVIFAILFLLASMLIQNFASMINMKGLGLAVSMSGMVACGMLFCLAAGEFDMSVGSIVACSGVTCAVAINATESITMGVLAGLGVGVLFGLVNGIVVAKFKINALITTLATMQMARGMGYIISDGKAVGIVEESFFDIGNSAMFGIPTPVWITAVCFVIFGLLLNKTTFGRNTLSMGGNEEASRLAGVNVVRTKIIIFTMTGFISALAGIILALASAAFVTYLAIRRLVVGPEAEGLFTLFGLDFFLMGIQLFGIGLLGEYVGRIYQQVRERPRFTIQAVLEQRTEG